MVQNQPFPSTNFQSEAGKRLSFGKRTAGFGEWGNRTGTSGLISRENESLHAYAPFRLRNILIWRYHDLRLILYARTILRTVLVGIPEDTLQRQY
jgi:hypothetical protein